jgi:ribosome-associated protein
LLLLCPTGSQPANPLAGVLVLVMIQWCAFAKMSGRSAHCKGRPYPARLIWESAHWEGATNLMKEPKRLTVAVGERPINLTQVLKLAGCVESGGAGKVLIAAGRVYVNGEIELRKRCQMKIGDTIDIVGGPTIVLT